MNLLYPVAILGYFECAKGHRVIEASKRYSKRFIQHTAASAQSID